MPGWAAWAVGVKIRRGVSNPGSGVILTKVVSFHSVSLRDMMITLQGGWNPPSGSLPWLPAHAAHRPLLRPKIDKIVVFRISKFAQKTDRPKITFFRICWWFSGSPTLIGRHFGSQNRSRRPLLRDFWRQNRIFHSGSSFRCFFATRRQKISDTRKTSFLENHRFS